MRDDPRILEFLNAACRKVRSKYAREEVREELLAHLEESIAAKLEAGSPQGEAVTQAIAELGEPCEIAHGLAVVHRPTYLEWPFLVAAFGMVTVIGILGLSHLASVGFRQVAEKQRLELETFQERFLTDQAILSAVPFFAFPGKHKDAGTVMNQRIPWMDSARVLKLEVARDAGLKLSEDLQQKLKSAGWFKQKINLDTLDTTWISELSKYDHWDIFRSGPLKIYLDSNPNASFWTLPVPNYSNLQSWAKIRILRGIGDRKVVPALTEVRHLARLIYSQELTVSDIFAVQVLRIEKEAYEFAISKQLLAPSDWEPMSEEILIRARRAVFGYKQFLDLWTDPALLAKLFNGKTATAGMCSTFTEGMTGLILSRAFLSSALPWEADLTEKFDQMNTIIRQAPKHCRLNQHFLALWKEPERAKAWLRPASVSLDAYSWQGILLGYLPHVAIFRRWALAEFYKTATPTFLAGSYNRYLLPEEKPSH